MKIIMAAVLVVLVSMASGCVDSLPTPDSIISSINSLFRDYYGEDVIKVVKSAERTGPVNVLGVARATVVPHAPVLPEQFITFTLLLESAGVSAPVKNIFVEVYDAPNFKNIDNELCNDKECEPGSCLKDQRCELVPGSQEAVEFRLLSPSEKDIEKIKTIPTLSYRILYDYETESSFTFPVVDINEVERRQRSKSSLQLQQSLVTGSGPVALSARLEGPNYALGGKEAVIVFYVENKGAGAPLNSRIEPGRLEITFPAGIDIMSIGGTEVFVHQSIDGQPTCTSFYDDCLKGTGGQGCPEGFKKCLPCSVTKWNGLWRTCTAADRCAKDSGEGACAKGLECCVPKANAYGVRYESPYFICSGNACTNRGVIELYEGRSSPLYFKIKETPDVDVFQTFTIAAKLRYAYELRGTQQIEVRPYGT